MNGKTEVNRAGAMSGPTVLSAVAVHVSARDGNEQESYNGVSATEALTLLSLSENLCRSRRNQ
jgi:hypothetical protein